METYARFTDEELAALLRGGDRSAFAEIYGRYHSVLYGFALRRLGDREESKDLISDLFVSVWARHGEFSLSGSLAAYLFTSARNRVYDLVAKRKIRGRYIDSFRDYVEAGIDDADHLVRSRELSLLIDREIALLPERMREVFLLSRKTLLSQREIAQQLGISEATVKSHMHHALKLLKGRLGGMFFAVFL